MPSEAELEFIRENHFCLSNEELAEELDVAHSTISRWKRSHLDLPRACEKNRVEYEYGDSICEILDRLHNEELMTTYEMADELGVARKSIERWWEDCPGVKKRSQSEATELAYSQMSEEERMKQVKAAHETLRENYANGEGTLQKWHRDNPERAKQQAREAAALGTPAREQNGMEGVTGQDHHGWTGGKSLYDALKKQLPGRSWYSIRETERADQCYKCGCSDGRLSIHHIVPVMAGGTNGEYNRMTLCEECHGVVEAFTWDVFADPVYDVS